MLEDTECDTELCLTPGGRHYCPSSHSDSAESSRMKGQEGNTSQQQQQQQPITIFYGGRVCVCDATEIQARAIICMAQREMEEMAAKKQKDRGMEPYPPSPASRTPPAMPQLLNPGLSMKRSLKQFLQKRKSRTDG
ncbi:protein TIFY 5A-like [Elaeis guineensis]|uniref:protein TIFY 5A-like n=1 Tax=Elaeis guineensis var. tenera TaxID=51953 RepID=UPI00057A8FD3